MAPRQMSYLGMAPRENLAWQQTYGVRSAKYSLSSMSVKLHTIQQFCCCSNYCYFLTLGTHNPEED